MNTLVNWDATQFFRTLTDTNKLAQAKQFRFCRVSGLSDFQEVLGRMTSSTAFVCVGDIAEGYIELLCEHSIARDTMCNVCSLLNNLQSRMVIITR